MRLIVLGLPQENYGSKLLRDVFLTNEDPQIMNVEMNVMLLQYKVFPVNEWDSAIVNFV